jgi:hypothetical protein
MAAFGGLAAVLTAVLASGPMTAAPAPAARIGPARAAQGAAASCQHTFVPAYAWSSAFWDGAIGSRPAPSVIILDITGTGAGSAPEPHFQGLVAKAHAAGIKVIGYSSTEYGQRPAGEVEADVRNYQAWYHVNGMFLDLTASASSELGYYQNLASYIHSSIPQSVIWLNPGDFPAQGYMSVGNVVMVFEGTYAQYSQLQVPGWVSRYDPSRFVNVIYATPGSNLARTVSLAGRRRAGYLYVTDLPGSPNPYNALPSYWSQEVAAVAANCSTAGPPSSSAAAKSVIAPSNLISGQDRVTAHREGWNN